MKKKLRADCLFININVLLSALEGLPGNLQPIFRCMAHSQLISTPLVFDFPAGNLLADVIIGRAAKVTIDSSRKIIAAVSWRSPSAAVRCLHRPSFVSRHSRAEHPWSSALSSVGCWKSCGLSRNFTVGIEKKPPKLRLPLRVP